MTGTRTMQALRVRQSRLAAPVHPALANTPKSGDSMQTLLVFHEVDDVAEWVRSPRLERLFGPAAVTARVFRDPQGSRAEFCCVLQSFRTAGRAMCKPVAVRGMSVVVS